MQDCIGCLSPVNAKCVSSEKVFSSQFGNVDELLLHLDTRVEEVFKVLSKEIDSKTISTKKPLVTDYIQELINKVDVLSADKKPENVTFTINSTLTGNKEKTLLQIITILLKEVEALKQGNEKLTSSLYIPNV